jgi:hypothetical protein
MKINFTKKQYETPLKTVYMANSTIDKEKRYYPSERLEKDEAYREQV